MSNPTSSRPAGRRILDGAAVEHAQRMLVEVRRRFFRHPQIADIEADLERVLAFGPPEPGTTRPARTYLLVGDAGAGKSTLLRRFVTAHPPVKHELGNEVPVVLAEVPAAATVSGTMRAILIALGGTFRERATEADLTRILVHHLQAMHVRVLVLDEAQHLIDRDTGRFAYKVADWVKSLANSGISVVLAGLPEAAMAYSFNEQLARRSMGCQRIQAFPWDGLDPETDWMLLLAGMAEKVPELNASILLEGDVPHRLHLTTHGLLGRLVDFLALCIESAVMSGQDRIDRAILMAVEEGRRDLSNPTWVNVFRLISLEGYDAPTKDESRRTRIRRGKRGPRQADILHDIAA